MTFRGVALRRAIGPIALVAVVVALAWPLAARQARPRGNSTVNGIAANLGRGGEFNPQQILDALAKSGLSELEANKAFEELLKYKTRLDNEKIDRENKENQEKSPVRQAEEKEKNEQNASGTAEWDFGGVFRDRDYPVTMPLENNCRVPREIVFDTWPSTFILEGPKSVVIPPKSKVDVKMTLVMSRPPTPPGPYPPGLSPSCYDLSGRLHLYHNELIQKTARSVYVCKAMERTITISMHVHQHGPPDPPGGGGGGGGGSDKKDQTCDVLWNTGELFTTPSKQTAEDCRDEIRSLAKGFFGPMLETHRRDDPLIWSWAPLPGEIDAMPVAALMKAKVRADGLAAPRFVQP